jgi:hypothetical protein
VGYFCKKINLKRLAKVKQSPNSRKFAQSDHPLLKKTIDLKTIKFRWHLLPKLSVCPWLPDSANTAWTSTAFSWLPLVAAEASLTDGILQNFGARSVTKRIGKVSWNAASKENFTNQFSRFAPKSFHPPLLVHFSGHEGTYAYFDKLIVFDTGAVQLLLLLLQK